MSMASFFTLHSDLPREGPGDRASLDWAVGIAGVPENARILDAACGPGPDIERLLAAAPRGHVTAIDTHAPFVEQAAARYSDDPRVRVQVGDMATPDGRYDFIWCASALYFLGVEAGLLGWRDVLTPGGAIAFSDAVWLSDARPPAAVANWADYPAMTDVAGVHAQCARAGYVVRDHMILSDAAWEAYYAPLDQRIEYLRKSKPDDALEAVLQEAEAEAAAWRAHRDVFGYGLFVVAPE